MFHKLYLALPAVLAAIRAVLGQSPPLIHLNGKTKPFLVDGSALPNVDFDIGESYAGTLPIANKGDQELFFWYVPSNNPAATDEITIWLNGGPGCSSLLGFFQGNGPAIWQPGVYRPVPNTFAWNKLSNVVWIDQPVGTGFSLGKITAKNEFDVADQFRGFWKNFVDLFELHGRKIFITGESYAGAYVPYITDGMLNQTDTKYFNAQGILLYDPIIGDDYFQIDVPSAAFMDANPATFPFTDAVKTDIRSRSKECGYDNVMQELLTYPPQKTFKKGKRTPRCALYDELQAHAQYLNPCLNINQIHQPCPTPWNVLEGTYPANQGFKYPFDQPYFNRSDVKRQIHVPEAHKWAVCGLQYPFKGLDNSAPSGNGNGPLKRVTEKTNNVIIGHGTLDSNIIMNGTLLVLQNMVWNGQQGFSSPPVKSAMVPKTKSKNDASLGGYGRLGTWTSSRGLTFVEVFVSGHEVPQWAPSTAYCHLQLLLGRIQDLSSGCKPA